MTNPLTELSRVGSSSSKLVTELEPSKLLAVLIKALVWLVVGAAKRSAKSVTTASMLSRLCAERNVSMAPMEEVSAESKLVSEACRSIRWASSVSLAARELGKER